MPTKKQLKYWDYLRGKPIKHLKEFQFKKNIYQGYGFKKGNKPICTFLKGQHASPKTEFKKGIYYGFGFKKGNKVNVGRKRPDMVGNSWNVGKKHSAESVEKRISKIRGEKNWRWIKDRSLLKRQNRRNDPSYIEWRKGVHKRDNWKCKINNQDCKGRIEVHHILGWTAYPELRYEINNGITLCHAHHPRKRVEEQRLIPFFKSMVEVS